jgi:hypothetical protein
MQEFETVENPVPASSGDGAGVDALDRPMTEVGFVAFRNQVNERLGKMEAFIDGQMARDNAALRDTALDVPKMIEIGGKEYELRRLPAGYRRLMMEKLASISKLVPDAEPVRVEQVAALLKQWYESIEGGTPQEDVNFHTVIGEIVALFQRPGLLGKISSHVPAIFKLMCEVIQLALQVQKGRPVIQRGVLQDAVLSIEEVEWGLEDIDGVFSSIIEMNIPIFFTIRSLHQSLRV